MSKYSCRDCLKQIQFGESFSNHESGTYCNKCYENRSVTLHKVMVTLDSGLTYTGSSTSVNGVWIDVCQFILESGSTVNQVVPYQVLKFKENSDV